MPNTPKECRVVTGKVTFAYLNVNHPKPNFNHPERKPLYSAQLIIPKSDKSTMDKIQRAIACAYDAGAAMYEEFKRRGLMGVRHPVMDGEVKYPDRPEYKDTWIINANNSEKPGVVDAGLNHIFDTNELYSGIIGRASIQFYPYNVGGTCGIACSLKNIQKLADGPHLGGDTVTIEQDFGGEN